MTLDGSIMKRERRNRNIWKTSDQPVIIGFNQLALVVLLASSRSDCLTEVIIPALTRIKPNFCPLQSWTCSNRPLDVHYLHQDCWHGRPRSEDQSSPGLISSRDAPAHNVTARHFTLSTTCRYASVNEHMHIGRWYFNCVQACKQDRLIILVAQSRGDKLEAPGIIGAPNMWRSSVQHMQHHPSSSITSATEGRRITSGYQSECGEQSMDRIKRRTSLK